MRSQIVYLENIEDINDFAGIAQNLLHKFNQTGFQLGKNTLGVLFCDIDLATDDFAQAITEKFTFPIVGASALANLTADGYHRDSASLLIMTADDAFFSSALSEKFNRGNYKEQIIATYQKAEAKLQGEQAKAIFVLSPLVSDKDMHTDFASTLSEVSGGLPVFGGVASDYMDFANYQVIYQGQTHNDSLIILLIGGNVRPVSTANDRPSKVGRFAKVTQTDGAIIKQVDGMNFVEYCHSLGIEKNLEFVTTLYVIRCKYTEADGRTYYVNRTIQELYQEQGWARSSAVLPVGTEISLCTVARSDIVDSCTDGLHKLLAKMQANQSDAYEYSTVFAFTCVLRHMIMAHESFKEGEVIHQLLPQNINLSGFYTLGEFGPVEFEQGGQESRFLNCALVFCAL